MPVDEYFSFKGGTKDNRQTKKYANKPNEDKEKEHTSKPPPYKGKPLKPPTP